MTWDKFIQKPDWDTVCTMCFGKSLTRLYSLVSDSLTLDLDTAMDTDNANKLMFSIHIVYHVHHLSLAGLHANNS